MGKFERTVVQVSIEDVIRILENVPASSHIIPYITIVEVMNRVSIAHLSIERAFKFLIQEAGGKIVEKHHLGNRFRDLRNHDPESANFLQEVFVAAVRHYGLNANAEGMTHLQSLESYLETTGSDDEFNDVRYWELKPSLEEILLHQIFLAIHMELVHGLHEILIEPDRIKETVESRVKRAVETEMWPSTALTYGLETTYGHKLDAYIRWINECGTLSEALADAVRKDFVLENDFVAEIAKTAYKSLLAAKDPAVRYFASTLDVLPRQPRDLIPGVKWLGDKEQRNGEVSTPSGEILGFIQRGPDRLWYITPIKSGPTGHLAKARTKTDALCYLGQLLTRPAQVTLDGERSGPRIVGEERHVFKLAPAKSGRPEPDDDETKMYTAAFWDENHGIEKGQEIRIESQRNDSDGLTFSDALSGEVQEVRGHQISVMGRCFTVVARP